VPDHVRSHPFPLSSVSFSLTETSTPTPDLSARTLLAYCIYPPTELAISSRKRREGNLSVRTMRISRSASVYGPRNVPSSFIPLLGLAGFGRIVNENDRASRRSTFAAGKVRL